MFDDGGAAIEESACGDSEREYLCGSSSGAATGRPGPPQRSLLTPWARDTNRKELPEPGSCLTQGQRAAAAAAAVLLVGASVAFAYGSALGAFGQGGGGRTDAAPRGGTVLTSLSEDHPAGATQIQVESTHGFEIGDAVTISHPVLSWYSEDREIVDMGSIILNRPLEHRYPAGSRVRRRAAVAGAGAPRPAGPAGAPAAAAPSE
ncbi:unnamed protein product, partial [Prorocentrum cordatum]